MTKRNRRQKTSKTASQPHHPSDRAVVSVSTEQKTEQKTGEQESQSQPEAQPSHWYSKLTKIKFEHVSLSFTAIIAAATTIYAFVSYHQWSEMRSSVKAMVEANRIAQQNLIVLQSPYIHLISRTLRPLEIGKSPTIDAVFRNFGKIAAEHFGVGAIIEIRQTPPTILNTTGGQKLGELPPETATKPYAFVAPFNLTPDQVKGITDRTLTLYVYGLVQFDNPLTRVGDTDTTNLVSFCSEYDPSRRDREMVACDAAPQLMVNGHPLKRTHQLQRVPEK